MQKNLHLKPDFVYQFLIKVLGILMIFYLFSLGTEFYLHYSGKSSFTLKTYVILLFDFNSEKNIPTYFNTTILLISAGLLAFIAKSKERRFLSGTHKQWLILSGIFLFLSIDELFSVHEIFMAVPLREMYQSTFKLQTMGILYFSWIIPYLIFVIFTGIYFSKFLVSLPGKVSINFLIAGAIYVSGAIGMEMLEGYLTVLLGEKEAYKNIYFKLWIFLEETMEMFGIIFFIRTLLNYIAVWSNAESLTVNIFINSSHPNAGDKQKAKIKNSSIEHI